MEIGPFPFIIMYGLLPFFKKSPEPEEPKKEDVCKPIELEAERYKKRCAIYEKILDRYRELIETNEDKSVSELRSLVQPENEAVKRIRDGILKRFQPYIFERDFEKAAEEAYSYCRDTVVNVALPIEFWMKPEDIVEVGAADEMDKAIFLCSLLISMQNQTAKVVVETSGGLTKSYVSYEIGGEYHLMNPARGIHDKGRKEDVVGRVIGSTKDKTIYEFNNIEYKEW